MQQVRKGTNPQRSRACMQRHGVNGVKSSRARVDSKCPPWCWSWNTPARRPCPVVLCGADSKPSGRPGHRNTLRRSFPTARRGFILPLPMFWSPQPAVSPLTHTVRKHKGEHGASYQRGEEEPPRLQREAPNKLPSGGRARLQHLDPRRPVGGGAAATGTAGAVRHARSTADPIPQRVCQPQLLQDSSFSPLRKGPRSPRLDPHPGTWVAST